MKKYGYVRVSSRDQNPDRQLDALRKLQIAEENIYVDKMSGKNFDRPNYKRLLRKGNYVFTYDELNPSFEPEGSWASKIEWSSSDESVAMVGLDNLEVRNSIFGIKPGTCTITATLPNNATAECKVTVIESTGISNESDLKHCLAFTKGAMEYKLNTDIVCENEIRVPSNADIVLDLNGKSITFNKDGMDVAGSDTSDGKLWIKDSSKEKTFFL